MNINHRALYISLACTFNHVFITIASTQKCESCAPCASGDRVVRIRVYVKYTIYIYAILYTTYSIYLLYTLYYTQYFQLNIHLAAQTQPKTCSARLLFAWWLVACNFSGEQQVQRRPAKNEPRAVVCSVLCVNIEVI